MDIGDFFPFSLPLNTWNRSERWLFLWVSSHNFIHKSIISDASGFQHNYDANIIALNKETIAATWIGGDVRLPHTKAGKARRCLLGPSELWGGRTHGGGIIANVITWIMHNPPCPNIINGCAISVHTRRLTRAQMFTCVAAELSRDNCSYLYAEINWERCGR